MEFRDVLKEGSVVILRQDKSIIFERSNIPVFTVTQKTVTIFWTFGLNSKYTFG